MAFSFYPSKIVQADNAIKAKHTKMNRVIKIEAGMDSKLRELIRQIVLFDDEDELLMLTYALDEDDIYQLAGYVPFNYENVKMDNLYIILNRRMTKESALFLYHAWHNSYEREDSNNLIRSLFLANESFQKALQEIHLEKDVFLNCIESYEVPVCYGNFIKEQDYPQNTSIKEKLAYFGVRDDSKLYKECEFIYLLFCSKSDYMFLEVDELIKILKKYSDSLMKKFMLNFLKEMPIALLVEYPPYLANYLISRTGDIDSNRFNSFFSDIDISLKRKYTMWVNRYRIISIFGNDVRSEFWKQYEFIRVFEYRNCKAVVMETENCYISEFLNKEDGSSGKIVGKAYFYNKDEFENRVRKLFATKSHNDVKSILFNDESYWKEFFIHHEGWQYEVAGYIARNNVTKLIDLKTR